MSKRLHQQRLPTAIAPNRLSVHVDAHHWVDLHKRESTALCILTLFHPLSPQQLCFRFLNEDVLLDIEDRCLKRLHNTRWEKTDDPLLELVTVMYLLNVREIFPIAKDIVGANDLKEGHFFRGPHALSVDALLKRYGHDINGFKETAEYLEGEALEMADAAYRLLPFPRVPLYYLFWEGDEEFPPRINVLFDRSIEKVFAADAIWGLVSRVSAALLRGVNPHP